MDKRIELYWVEKYPDLFAGYHKGIYRSPMAWGVTCGEGWFELLDQLWKDLSKIEGVVLAQVKEKFAGLRVYLEPMGGLDQQWKKANAFINAAEGKSFKTCEGCGEAGERRGGGWIFTACDDCSTLDRDDRWAAAEQIANKIAKKLDLVPVKSKEKDVP